MLDVRLKVLGYFAADGLSPGEAMRIIRVGRRQMVLDETADVEREQSGLR